MTMQDFPIVGAVPGTLNLAFRLALLCMSPCDMSDYPRKRSIRPPRSGGLKSRTSTIAMIPVRAVPSAKVLNARKV
jgi:hypothetical protein